jgi:hypothetical protein
MLQTLIEILKLYRVNIKPNIKKSVEFKCPSLQIPNSSLSTTENKY